MMGDTLSKVGKDQTSKKECVDGGVGGGMGAAAASAMVVHLGPCCFRDASCARQLRETILSGPIFERTLPRSHPILTLTQ